MNGMLHRNGALRSAFTWLFPILAMLTLVSSLALLIRGPFLMDRGGGLGEDMLTCFLLLAHLLWLFSLSGRKRRTIPGLVKRLARGSEVLLVPSLILFLFALIYASNANMNYAQWFAETSGNLRLAPDSTIQRMNALVRFLPFLLLDLSAYFAARIGRRGRILAHGPFRRWAVLLALVSAGLVTLAFPSPLFPKGFPVIAWIAPVPLLLVLQRSSLPRAWWCGVSYGALQALLGNYWLGTYDLLSLHFVTVYHGAIYALFLPLLIIASRALPGTAGERLRLPLMAIIWVGFDFVRSNGFLGYPWGILGVSQYQQLPLIQIASVFGVWGTDLHVWLVAALVASLAFFALSHQQKGLRGGLLTPLLRERRGELLLLSLLLILLPLWGFFSLKMMEKQSASSSITIALIQQNTDPRKNDYRETLDRLKLLSHRALSRETEEEPEGSGPEALPEEMVELRTGSGTPDLVAWPETAFVPNLRKWGALEPHEHPNAALARDFLTFQEELGTWLLTGNDDYEEVRGEEGKLVWNHYNAAVLFSDQGERVGTYRKIHMVPFSEYFPYKEEFPLLYELIMAFDANLWEAGDTPVVFEHPGGSFITPICFEDSFPGEIAEQVNLGVDFILNISNDFWSRTETEGQQHGANAVFRAVESRRPMVRATASGLTCIVAPTGEILAELPHYRPGYILADLELYERRETFYLRHIDLLPRLIIRMTWGLLLLAFLLPAGKGLAALVRRRSRTVKHP